MLAAIATSSMLPAVAQAAFPGTNGKLAFGSARNGYPADNDLYSMANDGTGRTRITSMSLDELNPSWSPSGAEIAFERNRDCAPTSGLRMRDGTNLRQLTTHARQRHTAGFLQHRNEDRVRKRPQQHGGFPDLFVMDANGANQVAITNTPTIDETTRLVARRDRHCVLARRRHLQESAQRREPHTLDEQFQYEIEPDWSPNSSQIVFRQGINADDELWKINANGSGLTPLTAERGRGRGTAGLVAAGRQDRVHSRRVQGRRGLHDECGRFRGHPHHEQHRHGRRARPGRRFRPLRHLSRPIPRHPVL